MIFSLFKLRNLKDHRRLSPFKKTFWYIIIFGFTSLAFYYNFNYRMAKIEAKSAFYDETSSISKEARQNILELVKYFKRDYATPSRIQLLKDDVYIPNLKTNELFIGVSYNKDQAILILPPLINKALSQSQKTTLDSQLLQCVVEKTALKTNHYSAKLSTQILNPSVNATLMPESSMSYASLENPIYVRSADSLAKCVTGTLSSIISYLNE